jgi:tetratricopeptide (TPR) repeat protein
MIYSERAMRSSLSLFLLGCVAVAGAPAWAQDDDIFEDEIIPRDIAPIVGVKIEEDTWKTVVGRKMQGKLSVPGHTVIEVVYFDAPRDYARGVRRVKRRYYTKAIDESFLPMMDKLSKFRKVGGRPWPEQYCLYYLGVSHLKRAEPEKSDSAKAREYFTKLVDTIPDSRFIFEALMGIGDAWHIEGRYEEAAKAYKEAQKKFETMSKVGGLEADQRTFINKLALSAELRQAEMLDAQKKWQLAKSAYDKLFMKARGFPEIRSKASVGAVRALVSDGVYTVAIKKCSEMIEMGEREGLTQYLAGAYLAMGDCYFERAGDNATPEDLVTARWNYLRVATLYFRDPSMLPKARFRIGRCYERLAGVANNADGKRGIELARRQYMIVRERYKDSIWADEAKKRLAALEDQKG